LKRAAAPPPTEEEAFDEVIRNENVPKNITRSTAKRKPLVPPGMDRNDPTSAHGPAGQCPSCGGRESEDMAAAEVEDNDDDNDYDHDLHDKRR